jgi:putative transposase
MSDYRRYFVPGGNYFFTLVSYRRRPQFAHPGALERLREAVASVQREQPFRFLAAVVLPNHMHFLWTLPSGDADFSRRIGRMKVHFTRSCGERASSLVDRSPSRRSHRESDVWQRRFWEHSIDEEGELGAFLDYIHYNPVKHGLTSCPHAWPASSFSRWVALGLYEKSWGCCCDGRTASVPNFKDIENRIGES